MFGWFRSGDKKSKPISYEVWLNDPAHFSAILRFVKDPTASDAVTILVPHFRENAVVLRELLKQDQWPFDEPAGEVSATDAAGWSPGVYLLSPGKLRAADAAHPVVAGQPIRVLSVEPHFLHRFDAALVAWAAQLSGDVSCRFYASLDSPMMALFAGDRTRDLLVKLGMTEAQSMRHEMVSRSIRRAQDKILRHVGEGPYPETLSQWQALVATGGM